MNITEEKKNNNAIDTVVTLTVAELAEENHCTATEILPEFLRSRTAKMLYDESTKLWWSGPSDIAIMYKEEQSRKEKKQDKN